LYELARDRLAREEERGQRLDSKLATLLTGVMAAIGFSFRVNPTAISTAIAILYFIPLGLIVTAYTTRVTELAPDLRSLEKLFPSYPVSTLIEAVKAMRMVHEKNRAKYNDKAVYLNHAVVATLVVTLIALVAQLLVAMKAIPVAP
jgi:disulfide bond formation protein DsbB